MKTRTILAVILIGAALFFIAYRYLSEVTSVKRDADTGSEKNLDDSTKTSKSGQLDYAEKILIVNPKTDLNLRICPGTDCDVLAVLEKKSHVVSTGKVQSSESDNGAILSWQEVRFESGSYCLPSEMTRDGCLNWRTDPPVSGWVNAVHLRLQN